MTYALPVDASGSVARPEEVLTPTYPDAMWLIRLRWIAVVGVLAASVLAGYQEVVDSVTPLFTIAVLMAVFNLGLWWGYRAVRARGGSASGASWICPQLVLDMCALTLLLHFSGGAENPFEIFFAFHVAIGAVFLPRRTVWLIGLLAAALNTGMVLGEFFNLLPHHALVFTEPAGLPPHLHHTPHDMHRMPEFVVSYLVAYNLMLVGIIHLVHTVAEHQRIADTRRRISERIATSRERLARIGEIATGMAHTVRNPLHGVINAVEMLRAEREGLGSDGDELFSLIQDGLERMERVTGRLLVLTRDSALTKVDTDVGALMRDTMRFVESKVHERNVKFVLDQHETIRIMLDPDHLFEALVNLVDNALAACGSGDVIQMSAEWIDGRRNGVCIRVDDTGSGIPADVLPKVLDPFFTTKPVGEGSGLGLAIANRIATAHDGDLTVESTVGRGTSVLMFIPARPGPDKTTGSFHD